MGQRITLITRTILLGLAISLAFVFWQTTYSVAHAQASQAAVRDKPFVVEYYYKTKWGHADEFIRLFKKESLSLP